MTLYVMDTDILSLYQHGHPNINQQANSRPATELAITVISVEEQLSGWYALLRHAKQPHEVVDAY
jgi:tRNA(fMet)-specific endonuclease VapC